MYNYLFIFIVLLQKNNLAKFHSLNITYTYILSTDSKLILYVTEINTSFIDSIAKINSFRD